MSGTLESSQKNQHFTLSSLPLFAIALVGCGVLALAYGVSQLNDISNQDDTVVISTASASVTDNKAEKQVQVRVDINGAVMKPGVYSLPEGSLVKDAVAVAGGWHEQADAHYISQELNLAESISDQSKIYIPFKGEKTVSPDNSQVLGSISSKIKINTASQSELESLEGIGEARAQKIIENRPYSDVADLVSKKIIPVSIFESIKDQISL